VSLIFKLQTAQDQRRLGFLHQKACLRIRERLACWRFLGDSLSLRLVTNQVHKRICPWDSDLEWRKGENRPLLSDQPYSQSIGITLRVVFVTDAERTKCFVVFSTLCRAMIDVMIESTSSMLKPVRKTVGSRGGHDVCPPLGRCGDLAASGKTFIDSIE
jgi:hypothetical protein